ncbi:MAG TPA: carboxypeptidase-like regulatory domain-containing protein [Candidatus Cybelea sp.]|nr:carboxypeptidase-like regulatory domain-containing protein [Candidatus Cybelea sp.]
MLGLLLLLSEFMFWPFPSDWGASLSNATVRGTVVDESRRGVSGATVYAVSNVDVAQTTSDSDGEFIFLTLLPGSYRLCASSPGYALDCSPRGSEPEELLAGSEYEAIVKVSGAIR